MAGTRPLTLEITIEQFATMMEKHVPIGFRDCKLQAGARFIFAMMDGATGNVTGFWHVDDVEGGEHDRWFMVVPIGTSFEPPPGKVVTPLSMLARSGMGVHVFFTLYEVVDVGN